MQFDKRKISFFSLLIALVLLCLPVNSAYSSADQDVQVNQQEITILNNSPYHITALFICPANSGEWQEVLGGTELRCGRQRIVNLNLDASVCKWDIKVVDSSGYFVVFQNLQMEEVFPGIHYYYTNGSGQIRFVFG